MTEPLHRLPLTQLDYRLIWWLLGEQVIERGVPTGTVRSGWRTRALRELGCSRISLWESQRRLLKHGIVVFKPWQRNLRICGEAFT